MTVIQKQSEHACRKPRCTRSKEKYLPEEITWFLGPKAENGDVFRDLLTKAIDSHIGFRHRYITITSSIWWEAQRCAVMIFPSGSNLCRSYIHKLLNFLFCGDCFLFLALKIAAIQYSYKVSLLACLAGVGRVKG